MIVRRYLLGTASNYGWCFTVQVVCKDGTTIQCQDFQATDSGVLFFQARTGRGEDEEEEEDERAADGFVPITELQFVLSDELAQQQLGRGRGAVPERAPAGVPAGGQAPPAGQVVQQQQSHQPPGPPGQQPRGPGSQ